MPSESGAWASPGPSRGVAGAQAGAEPFGGSRDAGTPERAAERHLWPQPRIGSLCSGYRGLDMAVENVFGGTTAWVSDIDPGASAILDHHWPDIPNLGDITAVDWSQQEPVDILTAGFPCQDVSLAGKRAGLRGDVVLPAGAMVCGECSWGDHDAATCAAASPSGLVPSRLPAALALLAVAELNTRDLADPAGPPAERVVKGTRSGLWRQVARAIDELRPELVVIENVRGLLSADAHGNVEPCPWCVGDAGGEPVLRALGAVLGDLADLGFDAEWQVVRASDVGAPHQRGRVFVLATAQDADGTARDQWRLAASGQAESRRARADAGGRGGAPAADTDGDALREQPIGQPGGRSAAVPELSRSDASADAEGDGDPHGPFGNHGIVQFAQPRTSRGDRPRDHAEGTGGNRPAGVLAWGRFAPAIARWEHATGRRAPWATDARNRLSPLFVEWLMGLPTGHVTAVPDLSRTAQLKALGNGVVPQQAEAALRVLADRAELGRAA